MNPAGASSTTQYLLTGILKLVVCIFSPDNCVLNTQDAFFNIVQSMLLLGILIESGAIFQNLLWYVNVRARFRSPTSQGCLNLLLCC